MRVVEHADPEAFSVRSHPWSGSASDPAHRHHDLRRQPELIRTALEDLVPWNHEPAIETFYQLIEWLNGPASILETNDCAFNGPAANDLGGLPGAMACSGRLMLLFRDLPLNTRADRVHRLTEAIARGLAGRDEDFAWGVIGATIVPVRFTALGGSEHDPLGSQLMLSFWVGGSDARQTMDHLDRTLSNLSAVLRGVAVRDPAP